MRQRTEADIQRDKITGLLGLVHDPELLKRIYKFIEYLYLHND